ncbi:MAG: hypothetical protein K6U03_10110, partial [Firmicutes bacterium]|nr:hypothetical protein [Bacillota bacterium]
LVGLAQALLRSGIRTPDEGTVLSAGPQHEVEAVKPNVTMVLTAGLVDGVNPCAFLTMVFLMSLLYAQGTNRKRLAIIGIFYPLAVFFTYLAAGLGLSHMIGAFERFAWLLEVLQFSLGFIAIFLGLMSLRDSVMMLRGNFGEVKLRLPRPVVKITHKVLRRGISLFLPIGATAAGVTVSMLEFMCTGQIYLPTLMYMRTVATTKTYATFLLVSTTLPSSFHFTPSS